MIKLTTQEARHIEGTLEYLLEVLNLMEDMTEIPEDLGRMGEEALEIIHSLNAYAELEVLDISEPDWECIDEDT